MLKYIYEIFDKDMSAGFIAAMNEVGLLPGVAGLVYGFSSVAGDPSIVRAELVGSIQGGFFCPLDQPQHLLTIKSDTRCTWLQVEAVYRRDWAEYMNQDVK